MSKRCSQEQKQAREKSEGEKERCLVPFSNGITAHFQINSFPLSSLPEINPSQLKDGGVEEYKKKREAGHHSRPILSDGERWTEGLASTGWKRLLVLRLHSPPFVSLSAHTSTAWSPLATRRGFLYTLQPIYLPISCQLRSSLSGTNQAHEKLSPAHGKGKAR